MNEVKIIIFQFDTKGQRKEVYRNVIRMDSSIVIPYDSICSTMSLLYPNCMMEFVFAL